MKRVHTWHHDVLTWNGLAKKCKSIPEADSHVLLKIELDQQLLDGTGYTHRELTPDIIVACIGNSTHVEITTKFAQPDR